MDNKLDAFTSSPEYKALSAKRKRLILPLLIITIGAYMAFILVIAFSPESLGRPIGDSVLSNGIAIGFGLIVFNFLITLYYVYKANRDIEPLIARVHELVGAGK